MAIHPSVGSLWNRWDLHFHTPSSFDYKNKQITNQQIVDSLVENGVRVVAITDHHVMDIDRIRELQKLGEDKLTVLPGIELRDDHGGDPIHYICIFPEDCDLDHVWTILQGSLGLTAAAIKQNGGDEKIYIPIEKGAKETRNLGGVVSIHAGAKSNSIEGIKNKEQFQQRIKFDISDKWVDIFEVGQIKDIDIHLNKIFPATGLNKPLLICSDNHNISEYELKTNLWLRADPTFRGLLMVLREPQSRVYVGDCPEELSRIEKNKTKYIQRVQYARKPTAPDTEKWFDGEINFNPGLVAIVGNKGSGKSALDDTIGHLGGSNNQESFSFLCKKRFQHPKSGLANHFDASIEWASGEVLSRPLSEMAPAEEVERVKYLPQEHVEKVCNELAGIGERNFEQELKGVIFSHVPESSRLGQSTLDDLVKFQSSEKQKRIDSLIKQMREYSRRRASLELQASPENKRKIEERIKQLTLEIEIHEKSIPEEVLNPNAEGGKVIDKDLLSELTAVEEQKAEIEPQIEDAKQRLKTSERRQAVAKKLLEKIANFQKDFSSFKESLKEEAGELGVDCEGLVSLTISSGDVEKVLAAATAEADQARTLIDEDNPDGLMAAMSKISTKLAEIQTRLDTPNRNYQKYLRELEVWRDKKEMLIGTPTDSDSLEGLKSALNSFSEFPAKIKKIKTEQLALAEEIHSEKLQQAEIFRSLYAPVQHFIDNHALAKDKLSLEFRAELTNEDFSDRILSLLALNRRGSFMGVEEGRTRVQSFTQVTSWEDSQSVLEFLNGIDNALHRDLRENPSPTVQLQDQMAKGKKIEEVYDLLYGLEYVVPRYVLRWEGKDLSMLSPGERGTLLLVFYLLIDKGEVPLIIDQPEGNLDNHTVTKVLVDCIKETRKKRQVFIVTHNPNLAVVCDADQVVHAAMDKANGNKITYTSGALENPKISNFVTDVLEGTRWAFDVRGGKYEVGKTDA